MKLIEKVSVRKYTRIIDARHDCYAAALHESDSFSYYFITYSTGATRKYHLHWHGTKVSTNIPESVFKYIRHAHSHNRTETSKHTTTYKDSGKCRIERYDIFESYDMDKCTKAPF